MQAIADGYTVLGIGVAFILVLLYLLPASRLLYRTVYRHKSWAPVRASWRALRLSIRRPKVAFRAACLWIEGELLDPRPNRPKRFEYEDKAEHQVDLREYRDKMSKWRPRARKRLARLMDEKSRRSPMITVRTCLELYRAEEDIGRYFHARGDGGWLADVEPNVFESLVEVRAGFIAPLHLLGGLVSHFESGWQPIISDYGKSLALDDEQLGTTVRALQLFLFDCWLLWGPSIPIGTCDRRWDGQKLLQFGYGDENNSIGLVDGPPGRLNQAHLPKKVHGGHPTMAARARVTGRLAWVSAVDHLDFCSVQQPELNSARGKLVIKDTKIDMPLGGDEDEVVGQYYSAYIWVSFVLCDKDGSPLHRAQPPLRTAQPWLDMLTFFEHGNLADEFTYNALKRNLVTKACASIKLILAEEPGITLRYGCAIDNCGCGAEIESPPPPGHAIVDMLGTEMDDVEFVRLRESGRVCLTAPTGPSNVYSACGLPKLLQDYTNDIAKRAKEEQDRRKAARVRTPADLTESAATP